VTVLCLAGRVKSMIVPVSILQEGREKPDASKPIKIDNDDMSGSLLTTKVVITTCAR
jgi:hypothetical protein